MNRIIDVWMQHPTKRPSDHEMFASLNRWTAKTPRPSVIMPEMTILGRVIGRVISPGPRLDAQSSARLIPLAQASAD